MPKKRSRYSSSLAADWVTPAHTVTEYTEAVETLDEKEPTEAVGDPTQAAVSISDPTQPAIEPRKYGRYKRVLPPNWIAPASEPELGKEDTRPQKPHSAAPSNVDLDDSAIPGSRRRRPSMKMKPSDRLAYTIDTSKTPRSDGDMAPPPAPTKPTKPLFSSSYQGLKGGGVEMPMYNDMSGPLTSIPIQRSFGHPEPRLMRRSQSVGEATVSPPISVGQQSLATTESPLHGRDLPAKDPPVSPSYSNNDNNGPFTRQFTQSRYPELGRSQSVREATISPPISIGQQSWATTESLSYGRDLPAKGPSQSPTYSIV